MSVTTKEELLELLRKHESEIRSFGVDRLGLFGSFVRNEPTPQSDVDVLVEFAPGRKSFSSFMDLSFFLEELFGRQVDLLTPESLSPYIGPHILREAEYVSLNSGISTAHP